MLAYKFDEITKEYKGTQNAQTNPLEGGYLLPANSTFLEAPKVAEGQIPVFSGEEWVVKTDKRGSWQVKLSDITFSEVDYIGDAEEGYQFITDEEYNKYQADNDSFKVIDGVFVDVTDTQEYKALKLQEAKTNKLNEALIGAKDYIENEASYQFDDNNSIEATDGNIGKLTAYALGFQTGQYEKVYWTSKEDNIIELNQEDLIRVLLGLGNIQSNVWNVQYIDYKNAITNASTIEAVNNIVIIYEV